MTAAQLHNQMIIDGIEITNQTIELVKKNAVKIKSQSASKEHKKAPKIKKELLKIDWNKSIDQIHNKIRGLSPFLKDDKLLQDIAICPCAWFYLNNKRVKIQKSYITKKINQSKIIDTDNKSYLYINFPKKALSLEMIQIEGKKPMLIKQFLQGNKINDTDKIT